MSKLKRRPLFNRNGWNVNGQAFAKELRAAMQPVIHKWMRRKGYAREGIHSIAITELGFAIALEQMGIMIKEFKNEQRTTKAGGKRSRSTAPHKHVATPARQSKSD